MKIIIKLCNVIGKIDLLLDYAFGETLSFACMVYICSHLMFL